MNLVEIKTYIPNIKLDVRYATTNNVTGVVLYKVAKAYLEDDVCKALMHVQTQLNHDGLGLVVWDAYRPHSVTKKLWELAPAHNKELTFADPKDGSNHNKGCAIDVTLCDLQTGKELIMPSEFDDSTNKARSAFQEVSSDVATRREQLRAAFEDNGFTRNPNEWWHFDWQHSDDYKILDIPIESLV